MRTDVEGLGALVLRFRVLGEAQILVESFGHKVVRFWGWGRVGIEGFKAQTHNRLRSPSHPSGPSAPLNVLREASAHGGFSKLVTIRYHGGI